MSAIIQKFRSQWVHMGDVWVIGTGVGNAAIGPCPFTTEGLGPKDDNAEQCWMPCYHGWWIPPPTAVKMVRVPVAPGCIFFWFYPSSLVLTRAAIAREMHWASLHWALYRPNARHESRVQRQSEVGQLEEV